MSPRRFVLALLVLCSLPGWVSAGQREIPATALSIAEDIAASSKKTVAVVDFTDLQGNVTELGRFVAEEMALGLVTARKGLSVVDRTHLKALMQENRLDATGLIDPATARRLGQVLGVEALVTGTITPFADSVRIVAKVLDTTTARIVSAASADLSKNRTIEELLARDIRTAPIAQSSSSAVSPATSSRPGATGFENGSVRINVGQLGVASDNRRVGISLIVENTSKETLYLALRGNEISLADDVGTDWFLASPVAGLPTVVSYNSRDHTEAEFAAIQPGGRMTVVMNFANLRSGTSPGKSFSVSASAVQYTPAGLRPLAIGIANIPATTQAPTTRGR